MVDIQELICLRDEALEASQFYGKRYKLGKLSVGHAVALWRSSDGGEAKLRDFGIRIGEFAPWTIWPTSLELMTAHEESRALEITAFEMELESGLVEIHKKLITVESPWKDLIKADLNKRKERKLDLHVPSNEDWDLLYEEMQRGASGAYALKGVFDEAI
jgi:hypothetical protein